MAQGIERRDRHVGKGLLRTTSEIDTGGLSEVGTAADSEWRPIEDDLGT
jgi:hypothetical protein